ncbi:MAG: class I SAM-dependent methyltransferase [Vicinamibacterales bacterium]
MLDFICHQIERQPDNVAPALDLLSAHLRALKRYSRAAEWTDLVAQCRAHPLRELLHQDPLTARAFAMSRGYQGDAELLDIIYAGDYRPYRATPVTPVGDAIFRYTIACQAPSAVRERRRYLAAQIDACCASVVSPHILSVACGHLRELEISRAVQTRAFGRFVGLDQDAATLAQVERTWGPFGVEAQPASVTTFLAHAVNPQRFDFIYAAGLYDYLEDAFAQLVTSKLFAMLRPGGRLLIGNYTHETDDAGYMEAYMGWRLIYRDAVAMRELAATVPAARVTSANVVSDTTGAVIYLDLASRAAGDD